VAQDGGIYQVAVNQQINPLAVGGIERLTAFSVAPDQRRIALIGDEAAWVAPLIWTGDTVAAGNPRKIYAGQPDLRSIAWTRLDRVLISGGSGTWMLTEVSIDGVSHTQPFGPALTSPIIQVVGYPYLLSQRVEAVTASGPVMVQADATAYKIYPSSIDTLGYDRTPSPSSTPSSGATPAPIPAPTYPFYID
jgi:hypothetical protein